MLQFAQKNRQKVVRPRKRITRKQRPPVNVNHNQKNRVPRRHRNHSPQHIVASQLSPKLHHSDNHKYSYADEEDTKEDYSCLLTRQNVQRMIAEQPLAPEEDIINRLQVIHL